ncbi:ASKHA domain-containing protein [Eubacteriaceae bacterium ES3]|nr:ASKHA domain-containing protein [Eubacteriaceae bacterium ES3]
MKIVFKPDEKSVTFSDSINLLEAASQAGVLINAACHGAGTCGKCKVQIIDGNLPELSQSEKKALTVEEVEAGFRLACKLMVSSDLTVLVPNLAGEGNRKKELTKLPEHFKQDIKISKQYVKIKKASMKNQKSDVKRLAEALNISELIVEPKLLSTVSKSLKPKKAEITAVVKDHRLIAVEDGNTEEKHFGLALDIGTTTVVGMLYNLHSGEMVDVESRTNPQSNFGADVISRIQFTRESEENLTFLQKRIIQCFNEMIQMFALKNDFDPNCIYDVTVVGNTTMSHLFEAVDPESLAKTPFVPVYCQGVNNIAADLDLQVNPLANVYFLPNIAGHVGADIVAGMLATNVKNLPGITLAVDIGTNGEVYLANEGSISTCSTAAGPAFEGACIRHGMRAAKGAIEKVSYQRGDIVVQTIENAEPVGICGSGLIDAVSVLIELEIIGKNGKMISQEECKLKNLPEMITNRLIQADDGMAFELYQNNGRTIILTQSDVREVQLAKAAIMAGMQTLLKEEGIETSQIDRVLIAGAFGNYIDKKNAVTIGLLPDIGLKKLISVGNAAGTGASMALLSEKVRKEAEFLSKFVKHIELSASPSFQDEYMNAMCF